MEIPNNFNYKISVPDLGDIVKYGTLKTASDLNCLRIATVEEVHYEDLTVTVRLLNKKTVGRNKDGTPHVRDYALIRAKICYCCPFITFPISKGDDCVLLFSDREIESWFINGDAQPVNHQRMHDLTDAFAIFGIRSLPKMIEVMQDALHLNYSKVIAENFHATNGTSGTFVSKDNKTITVVDGIVTSMTGGGDDPSITADEVINALGYTPANTELSNLETAGKAVIDGQWVNIDQSILSATTSLNGSTNLSYRIDVPNDGHKYEVMIRGNGFTGSTSGNEIYIIIKGNEDTMTRYICRARNANSGTFAAAGTAICTLSYVASGSTNFTLLRDTSWNGSCSELRAIAYRRIGTNS